MSDTPKTDTAIEWARPCGNDNGPPNEQYVAADFARELAGENTELKQLADCASLESAVRQVRITEIEQSLSDALQNWGEDVARLRELVRVKDEALRLIAQLDYSNAATNCAAFTAVNIAVSALAQTEHAKPHPDCDESCLYHAARKEAQ